MSTTRDQELREHFAAEPWGALLIRYGFDPVNTESAARRVAEKAAADMDKLRAALETLLRAVDYRAWLCSRTDQVAAVVTIEMLDAGYAALGKGRP